MRNKIRLALFALCTAVVSGTAELHADERIPAAAARQTAEASQYDIVYQENHTHTIAPAGETFSLDLLSVAQKMYTAIGLPDGPLLGYGVETRLTGLQQLQFGTDWTEGKTALTLDFKPNNGMDALSNTPRYLRHRQHHIHRRHPTGGSGTGNFLAGSGDGL
ncbi:MAG: hypothetical protein ACLUZZ_00110 [Alistipes inops]